MTETNLLPPRSEVPQEQTWDLESIFPTPVDWEYAYHELESDLPKLSAYQGRLGDAPQTLAEFLERYQDAHIRMRRIEVYAHNALSADTGDQAASARLGQARGLVARLAAATAFLNPELIRIGFERLRQWTGEVPELGFFAHYIDLLERRQAHIRSGEVEELLAMARDPFTSPYAIYTMLNNAELPFQAATASDGVKLEVGQASIDLLLSHTDREVRRTAWQNYADSYLAFKNTFATTMTGVVKQDVFNARARGYETALEAALDAATIPVEVFNNLIEVFRGHLPTWHRYWRLRRRILGYEQLHVYDLEFPLTDKPPVVPFKQAVDWISEGMAPLGEDYVRTLRRGCLEERWVDWARNRGKREGAYSIGAKGTHPFILMSYQDDLFSLSTLAHELGHSMHSLYTDATQPQLYRFYGLFAAEVASNFNQAMVRDHLFRAQADRDFQLTLIEEAMSNFRRYFFIMPTLARFELEVHTRAERGAPLSAAVMNELMADLFEEGYGGEVAPDRERIGITWAQFGHLYMNFYVYQYATGISGAHALARGILDGKPGAAESYLDFLRAGGSRYPLDALRLAGVDLSIPEPVEQGFAVLEQMVDRLESLAG